MPQNKELTMGKEEIETLLISDEYEPVLTEQEARELKPILQDFVRAYVTNSREEAKTWLPKKIREYLPEKSEEEVEAIVSDMTSSLEVFEDKKKSLSEAKKAGKTRESWLSEQALKATERMSQEQAVQYLAGLDEALVDSNIAMFNTVTTNAGTINQNPHLDGFIAERQHVETFNLNAKAKGSEYRAEVLEPGPGERYGKNSVDIVIKDADGKIVKRYQSKYCKDANATQKAFESGDYRGQQKLVPEGQAEEIPSKTTTYIEAPDGTKSDSLSKEEAKNLQEKTQNGEIQEYDWNNFTTKDIAKQVGRQAGYACLQGAAISTGFDIAHKLWNGEEIKAEDEVIKAIESGADFGIKSAVGSALKVGSEKGILRIIPKGTPAAACANIAFVGIENCKVLAKVASGDLTPREGMEKMADVTASATGGLLAMGKGAALGAKTGIAAGASIGAFFGGPAGAVLGAKIGSVVGGFVGGSVGYMAGSKVGHAVCGAAKKVASIAVNVVKTEGAKLTNGVKGVYNTGKAFLKWVAQKISGN